MIEDRLRLSRSEDSVLIIIDVQTRLSAAMPKDSLEQLKDSTRNLLAAAKRLYLPVIVTEQYPQGLGHTEPDVRQELPKTVELVEKTSFSACGEARFRESLALTGRQQVVLCGIEAHVCVLQTAIELQQLGYQTIVVEDAICSRERGNAKNAVERMRQADVIISNSESVLFEWLEDSTHEAFKEISHLLR